MNEISSFKPPQKSGYIFQIFLLILISAMAAFGLWQAVLAGIGPLLIIYLLPALVAVVMVPTLAYRIYGLRTANYSLEREGIHIRWGLRVEDIPIDQILWILRREELEGNISLPRFRWPGALLGRRKISGLGDVEFLASSQSGLILIATDKRTFALSPANPELFLFTASQIMEMGSLAPIESRSIYPTSLMVRVWSSKLARLMLSASLVFSLGLLVWVSFIIPGRSQVFLGFQPDGSPGDSIPAGRLMLLPILNFIFVSLDFFLGLFMFRKQKSQLLSFLLWVSAAILPLLFILGVAFVIRNSPV